VIESQGEEGAKRFRAMIEPKTPAARVGSPADIADILVYLMSDAAAAANGQTFMVSGGLDLLFP
jgi:NAD(P)-dependent dehydrogenase (short-subunit alcohol dehydrogenase family)